METNMKVHVQIVLLLTIASVFVSCINLPGFSIKSSIYLVDDYNKTEPMDIILIDTKLDRSESNYPNTVTFYLYTKDRRNDSVQLHIGDTNSLRVGQFDPKNPTVLIAHGWLNSYRSAACVYVRDAYFQNGDYNVILIDWSPIADGTIILVSSQIKSVAKYVSRMLDFLESHGMDPSKTIMVGHSFGAHIVGLASYYAKKKVNYIFGLDPAGPNFRFEGKGSRLSKDDANYVQAIHTTAILGLNDKLGHSDFYVGSAFDQVGCILPQACGHLRSYKYFSESINSKGFVARKCDSYTHYKLGVCNSNEAVSMGGATPDPNAKGTYYLEINPKPPFAKF